MDEKTIRPAKRVQKKKACAFCVEHAADIDYKDVAKLKKYITEKGKITLAPRQFNLIPEVLQKGKKVTYRESYIWLDGIIKKRITLSAIGSDGEERTFEVAVGL